MNRILIKSILITLCLTLTSGFLFAQDEDRMKQDMEVMQGILNEMLNQGNRFASRKMEMPRYEKGVGMIFRTPEHLGGLALWSGNEARGNEQSVYVLGKNGTISYSGGANVLVEVDSDEEDGDDSEKEEGYAKPLIGTVSTPSVGSSPVASSDLTETLTTFLIQYGDFATALKDEESIVMIHKGTSRNGIVAISGINVYGGTPEASSNGFSLKVKMKDLRDFRKGSLSEADLRKRITKEEIVSPETALEYRVFGRILHEKSAELKGEVTAAYLQEEDQEEVPVRYRFPGAGWGSEEIEQIPELGVIYSIRFATPASSNVIFFETKKKSRDEFMEKFEEEGHYDEWQEALVSKMEAGIPAIMLEYGRTLRRLPETQRLFVKLTFPACYECDSPEEIELSIPASALKAYDRKTISWEKGIESVRIERKGSTKE